MMRRKALLVLAMIFLGRTLLFADEGMWIPLFLGQINEKEMQAKGMKITAEDIYSINKTCLKDAILLFGGGCTASFVSDQGLILTNHHCGYSSIQSHSSLQNDYLKNGFWAMSKNQELANPGLTVTMLIRMEDVTKQALEGVSSLMNETEREKRIEKNCAGITKKAIEGTSYTAYIRPFFYGNQFFLFVTEVFRDVRLVGAPPSNIGKFGGDTDNWMWPRHTGDFSVFRVYANKENKPAEYSPENIPYKPKNFLKVNLKGVDKGDFTFVFGYPGHTSEYLTSYAVNQIANIDNPVKIKLRQKRLDIIGEGMNSSDLIRIQYSAKHASIANYWKKMIGESKGVNRMNGVAKKQEQEKIFTAWVNENAERKAKYGGLLASLEKAYNESISGNLAYDYFAEAGLSPEIVRYSRNFERLINFCKKEDITQKGVDSLVSLFKLGIPPYFKNYNTATDQKIFAAMMEMYVKGCDAAWLPKVMNDVKMKAKGNYNRFAAEFFKESIFSDEAKLMTFMNNFKKKSYRRIEKDPAYILAQGLYEDYKTRVMPVLSASQDLIDSLQRVYMKAIMEMQPNHTFYPDANSTLRVAYGNVNGFSPVDGVYYQHFTTLKGIMEKENPAIFDYRVEPKLKELYQKKDYGRYANKNGEMTVAFIANNHTTGGNSGSPVLDAYGNLIGLNFDRAWEGTMSDLMYDPEICRNITLDIRYCLFVIDKFAGAKHLVDEMVIVY